MSKSATIDKAKKLASKGNIKEAIKEWRKLLSDSQDDGNIYNAIGDLQLKANMKDDAITAYLEAADAFKESGFELKSIALYKKTIKVDDSRHDIYEKLADVHAERGLVGNAIGDYLKAAKYYVKKGDVHASLDVYRKMADLDPENFDIRIRIAEMCQKEGFEKEAVEEFGKVLKIYDGKGMTSEAGALREKILSLDPDYFENLSASAPASLSKNEPETLEEEMLSAEASDASGLVEREFPQESQGPMEGLEPETQEEDALLTAAGLSQYETSLPIGESVGVEPSPEVKALPEKEETPYADAIPVPESEDVSPKKITESAFKGYLTEAEVYFKYGLNSKAIDQLLLVSKMCPDREEPHLKLKEIYIQEGITEKAIETCCTLARIFHTKGDEDNIKETLNELSLLDQDGNYRQELHEEILAFESRAISSEVEIGEDLAPVMEVEPEGPEPGMVLDPGEEDSLGEVREEDEEQAGEEVRGEDKEFLDFDLEPVCQENAQENVEENAEEALESIEAESPLSEAEASSDNLVPGIGASLSEEIDAPPAGDLIEVPIGESSFEGISEVEESDISFREDVVSEPVAELAEEAIEESEEKEEEYVNLASILSEELGGDLEDSSLSGLDDTLLEGAFKDLKKEVEATHNEKDMETHYDLGIAYKEMDMIPEAITEFELASQGANRFQDSVIMLASCYRSRGAMNTAIKTLQDALEDSRCAVEKRVPLLYELAIMVDLSGDKKKAGRLYEEVYQAEPDFRDVAKRRRLNEIEKSETSPSESKSGTQSKKKNRISYI